MNRRCINIEGIIKYEIEFTKKLSKITGRDFTDLIQEHAPRERRIYCSSHCPVQQTCKFYGRYGMPEENK